MSNILLCDTHNLAFTCLKNTSDTCMFSTLTTTTTLTKNSRSKVAVIINVYPGAVEFLVFRTLKSCPPLSWCTGHLPPLEVCALKFCPPRPVCWCTQHHIWYKLRYCQRHWPAPIPESSPLFPTFEANICCSG